MKESSVRTTIKTKLSEWADVSPIENSAGTGMPDVNVSFNGKDYWLELKYREEAPKRTATAVLKGYLRPQQKVWMKKRLSKGSRNIYLFARVEDEYFLIHIDKEEVIENLDSWSLDQLYTHSGWYGKPRQSKDSDWLDMLKIMENLSYGHLHCQER